MRINRRLFTEIGLLATASFIQGAGFSLIAPFYPSEAIQRGNTSTHVGIVMSAYQLVMFLSSPLFGWALSRRWLRPRSLLWIGLTTDGLFSAAFGFVVLFHQSSLFFGISLILRIMQSLGNSASITCYFTLLGADFPALLGQLIPVIEAAFSAGLIAGPFFGGLLFHYLNFCATFLLFGASLALLGVLCGLVFPSASEPGSWKELSIWVTLRKPRVVVNTLLFIIGLMMIGFNDATLAVHLQQSAFSPFWGRLASSLHRPRLVCIAGIFLCSICYGISGLSSFYRASFQPSIISTVVAQSFLGIGVGAVYIPAFLDTLRYCLTKLHYPDNVGTYGLLSGLLTSALCLGSSIGSATGGALLDYYSYSTACQFVLAVLIATMAIIIITSGSPVPTLPVEKETDLLIRSSS
ncbi:MFS-type transporter SLC18B1-like [Tropilaelaps mercedesae]|uniref:MFS-type transporter SLC18B1-like n=1 Tax=Tropilaelaps mercedesae TaxID=418985 RepID=A0A1V9XN58_9ACAR|nr:MFS-type transporter SLC18B1-like [Tropilaelaps mercedesae]